ncbi:hypothetical protein EB796_005287 [Bugula neritina]|nr:hypothetical protein EB796_005287 [Bugula neritina]
MMLRPLMAAPVFLSIFYGLRGMTSLPVQSLMTGGGAWFVDLTVPDPYFILPAMSATTIFVVTKTGAEGASTTHLPPLMKKIFNVLPIIIFGVTSFQPSALALYWSTSNIISLVFSKIFETNFMKKTFNIPDKVDHPPDATPPSPFTSSFQDFSKLKQLMHEMEDRKSVGALKFKADKTKQSDSKKK